MPVKRKKSFWPYIILLVALLGLAWLYVYGLHVPDRWPWEPAPQPAAQMIAAPPTTPLANETGVGKDCLKQQAALLAKAKEETLAKVKAIAKRWSKARPKDADALTAYVLANPNGDPNADGSKKPDVLEGKVEWNVKLPSGATFHFEDARHVCICHAWRYVLTWPKAVPHRAVSRIAPARPDDCYSITFTAHGSRVRWGVGSADGPLKPSACNAQRQGPHGMFTAWYGICDSCIESTSVLQRILGAAVQIWHKYLYHVAEPEQTLRFGADVRTKVVYICVEYPDGSTHAVAVAPKDWSGTRSVHIKDAMWDVPVGTKQKHLH